MGEQKTMEFEINQDGAWNRMSTYLGRTRQQFKKEYYAEPEGERAELFEFEPSDYDDVIAKYNRANRAGVSSFEVDEVDALVLLDVVATLRWLWKGEDEIGSRIFHRFEAEVNEVGDELVPAIR